MLELKEADLYFLMHRRHKRNESCVCGCEVAAFSKLASSSAVTGFALQKGRQLERHTDGEHRRSGGRDAGRRLISTHQSCRIKTKC